MKLGEQDIFPGNNIRYSIIDPQLPFIYIPESDFNTLRDHMLRTYPDILCPSGDTYCLWEKTCDQVAEATNQDLELWFV